MFNNLAKVQMTHVPYRGAGPAITDLLGGQVDMIFGTAAAVPASSTAASCARSRDDAAAVAVAQGCAAIADTVPATPSRAGTAFTRPPAPRRRDQQAERRRQEGGQEP
jgi:tripartite-type tricarboxylate transporter receptor subunit TctC